MSSPDERARHDPEEPPRHRDELPRHPLRGPLIFGVVAATLELGALLWLTNC